MRVLLLGTDPGVGELLAAEAVDVRRSSLVTGPALHEAVEGTDAVLLVWPYDRAHARFPAADAAAEIISTVAARNRRVVLLSTHAVRDNEPPTSFHGRLEALIQNATPHWTMLRQSMPASITMQWAHDLRTTGIVRGPYAHSARMLLDERDLAEVAARVLLEPGHTGRAYYVTGPAALTHADRVRVLGETFGRPWRYEEVPREEFRRQLLTTWSPEHADGVLDHMAALVTAPEQPTDVVERITGHPARSLADWAQAHAEEFIPPGQP